jgi:hypothetical protein
MEDALSRDLAKPVDLRREIEWLGKRFAAWV